MSPLLDKATLAINDRELHQLLDEAAEYCRRVGRAKIDRRLRKRYSFDRALTISRVTADGAVAGEPIAAHARDISLWGISLFAVGNYTRHDRLLADLTLPRPDGRDRKVRLLVEVRHVKSEPTGDSTLGCVFLETLECGTE